MMQRGKAFSRPHLVQRLLLQGKPLDNRSNGYSGDSCILVFAPFLQALWLLGLPGKPQHNARSEYIMIYLQPAVM
jgi:hypothetical protein